MGFKIGSIRREIWIVATSTLMTRLHQDHDVHLFMLIISEGVQAQAIAPLTPVREAVKGGTHVKEGGDLQLLPLHLLILLALMLVHQKLNLLSNTTTRKVIGMYIHHGRGSVAFRSSKEGKISLSPPMMGLMELRIKFSI